MTREEQLACLNDRPCQVCKFRKENGCSRWNCVFEEKPEEKTDGPYRRLNPPEIKAVKELQELYEYKWNEGKYEKCDTLLGVFCILNKHLTGHTGWRIDFEGSKARDLENPRIEHKGLSYIPNEIADTESEE